MKHFCEKWFYPFIALSLGACASSPVPEAEIVVDYSQKGAEVNPKMYGIFFEEINHSGDGSLYGELLRNRNFEEGVIPSGTVYKDGFAVAKHAPTYSDHRFRDWKIRWDKDSLEMIGWAVDGPATYAIVSDNPLHPNTPNAMKLTMEGAGATLTNEGYWGVPVVKDDKYDLRFYLNPVAYSGNVTAEIVDAQGKVLSSEKFAAGDKGAWKEYTAVLTPDATDGHASFRLSFDNPGTVYVDYVSLFPQNTFMGRKNGMRKDVAQILADLKPGFVRWPGGCIAEGATLDNRVKWKNTIGDPMQRKSEWILWNYHCTWGFGYHEFLQFCEDIGADPMFVANVGLSCEIRNGDYDEDIEPYLQDIYDAIEYAQGDVTTEWGAKRAAAGHPEPFKIKYIELGNEQIGELYADRYNKMYEILKPKYPDITFISTLGIGGTTDLLKTVDMIDPHWYVNPLYFYENDHLFDSVERGKYDIYVGEYAVNQGVGPGNMDGALAEAAFISGMERNGDFVKIASYAPLIENSNHRDWATNLIWVKSDSSLGRSSYYVQQMFSNNVPTYNLTTDLIETLPSPFNGKIGISGDNIADRYRNIKVTDAEGNVVYEAQNVADFKVAGDTTRANRRWWEPVVSLLDSVNLGQGSIEFEARMVKELRPMRRFRQEMDSVPVYPSLVFSADGGNDNSYTLNLGSMGEKSRISISRKVDGQTGRNRDAKGAEFAMNPGEWYKVKVEFGEGGKLSCYVNGEQVYSDEVLPLMKHYAISGYDEATGETVIKVINGTEKPFTANIKLNCADVDKNGTVITLEADNLKDENSFDNPLKISPVETAYNKFGKDFNYTFSPASFTILRIKTSAK